MVRSTGIFGQGLADRIRRVKLAEKCRIFQVNPQECGFSVLTDRDGRVDATARKSQLRRAAVHRDM